MPFTQAYVPVVPGGSEMAAVPIQAEGFHQSPLSGSRSAYSSFHHRFFRYSE